MTIIFPMNITKFNGNKSYIPDQNIAIDESLISFKGRLKFRQYLPSKRARYGIKMYKLCESSSGYTYKFRVYEGRDTRIEPPDCPPILGVSGKIVWDLMHPLLDKGYHLYVDNFYTSIPLFRSLSSRGTAACGTVRRNQRGLPRAHIEQRLRKGESSAVCNENMLLVKYRDKRDVLVLTTANGSGSTSVPLRGTSTTVSKPDCILAYNKYMGGVDLSDQVLKPYSAMRKTRVWYKKLVVHMVQMALYNSYVLSRCAGHTGTFLEFQEAIIKSLIFGDLEVPGPSTSETHGSRIVPGQHFPSEVPQTAKKGKTQKRCRVCYKRGIRRDTIYQCDTCPDKPGLCMKECFRLYHTSMEY
ncbi:piggyBac transposable element-derived protein 4-like [Leptodactylus fuscus]